MTGPSEITQRDREKAVQAYLEVLEEEGLWVKARFKLDPAGPSISIIARHVAAAREEGRQEERRRWREWYDSPVPSPGNLSVNSSGRGSR